MGTTKQAKMVSRTLVTVAIAIIASARALPTTPDDVVPEGVELVADDTDIQTVDADVNAVKALTTTVFNDMKDLDNTDTNTAEHALFNKITHSAAFAKFTKVEGSAVEEAPSTTVVEAAAIAAFLEAAFKDLTVAEADLRVEVTRLQNETPA